MMTLPWDDMMSRGIFACISVGINEFTTPLMGFADFCHSALSPPFQ